MLTNPLHSNNFAVCVQPKPDESLKGFLLRLSAENGRQTLRELTQALDYQVVKSTFEVDGEDYEQFMSALSCSIQTTTEKLLASFSKPNFVVDSGRVIKDIRMPSPKVCPECMKNSESTYIKSEWEVAHHTHCAHHNVRLVHTCPCCGDELRWVSDIFKGCPSCGLRWNEYQAKSEDIPQYQKVCSGLNELELNAYLQALYQALVYASRPYDLTFDSFQSLPLGLTDLSIHLDKAYRLISSAAYFDLWIDGRYQAFSNERLFAHFSDEQLVKLAQLPTSYSRLSFLPAMEDIALPEINRHDVQVNLLSTLRKSLSKDPNEFRLHIDLDSAAYLLGVDRATVNAFVELGLLNAYGKNTSVKSRFVSAASISQLMMKILDRTVKTPFPDKRFDLVSIRELTKALPYFNADLPSLIKAFIADEVQTYCKATESFSILDMYVSRAEAVYCLEQHFTSSIDLQISASKIRETCGLKPEQFSALRNEFNFQDSRICATFAKVNSTQVSEFFSQYVLLNRWVKITGVKLPTITNYLQTIAGLNRYSELEKNGIFIYQQSPELTEALTRFLLYHKGEYHLLAQLCI